MSFLAMFTFILEISIICFLINFIDKFSKKNSKKIYLSSSDFKSYRDYYRDILKDYSPSELSYVDDFEIDNNREIVSTIMNLELKKKIEIHNNEIYIIDNNINNLKLTEQFLMKKIKDRKIHIYYEEIDKIKSEYAKQEAIEDGLIEKEHEKIQKSELIKNIIKASILIFFIIIINFIYFRFLFNLNDVSSEGVEILFLVIFDILSFFAVPAYYVSLLLYKEEINRRTELGEEINTKLDGLRNYISDYSLLKEKDQEYLKLWDEYLIYSVILGVNNNQTNIINDMMRLVNIEYVD